MLPVPAQFQCANRGTPGNSGMLGRRQLDVHNVEYVQLLNGRLRRLQNDVGVCRVAGDEPQLIWGDSWCNNRKTPRFNPEIRLW
jgi:hypothetical protein